MKVKIGHYSSGYSLYYYVAKYISEEIADAWNDTKWFEFLEKTFDKIHFYRKQKIKVKIDDYDIWSFDHTLAHIIHPALLKIREAKSGLPDIDNEDVPELLRIEEAYCEHKWNWVLNEMIWTFHEIANEDPNAPDDTSRANWLEDYKTYEARKQNGCRLFGKYYQTLWT